jgi:nitrate reductase NapAB chaperone NapD
MPICSYLVVPERGTVDAVTRRLKALPGCTVARPENRELLILLTDTRSAEEERAMRERIEALANVRALALTFGADG